jgi:hypothetical protein
MRRFLLKRCRYDNKEGRESCIDFGAGPSVPPMTKINLDIGHALSREDQRRNRRQSYLCRNLSPLSPEIAQRGSQKKFAAQKSCLPAWTDSSRGDLLDNRASRLGDCFSAGKMPASLTATMDVLHRPRLVEP